jgi:hypothetical protein
LKFRDFGNRKSAIKGFGITCNLPDEPPSCQAFDELLVPQELKDAGCGPYALVGKTGTGHP